MLPRWAITAWGCGRRQKHSSRRRCGTSAIPDAGATVVRAEAGDEAVTYAAPAGAGRFGILEVDGFVDSHRFALVA
jgi:hypothetical protein